MAKLLQKASPASNKDIKKAPKDLAEDMTFSKNQQKKHDPFLLIIM